MRNIQVNGDRLWRSLMEMAKIGATEKGGVCRLALSDLDKAGRELFIRWCEQAGCTVSVDRRIVPVVWTRVGEPRAAFGAQPGTVLPAQR